MCQSPLPGMTSPGCGGRGGEVMRRGLKQVGQRRHDALSEVRWDRLEHLLAEHYREQGYVVEHVGTGGSGRRFDGGVDLRMQRGGQVVLVQVKHWNAYKVPHNEVHQLIGLMVNANADAAILVTSGEFTKAAIEAATRNGLVELVDGEELRAMLGEVPVSKVSDGRADISVAEVGERLFRVAMDRALPAAPSAAWRWVRAAMLTGLLKLVALVMAIFLASLLMRGGLRHLEQSLQDARRPAASTSRPAAAVPAKPVHAAAPATVAGGRHCIEADPRTGARIDRCTEYAARPAPTEAEVRESRRKADAAMDVLRDSTPEM